MPGVPTREAEHQQDGPAPCATFPSLPHRQKPQTEFRDGGTEGPREPPPSKAPKKCWGKGTGSRGAGALLGSWARSGGPGEGVAGPLWRVLRGRPGTCLSGGGGSGGGVQGRGGGGPGEGGEGVQGKGGRGSRGRGPPPAAGMKIKASPWGEAGRAPHQPPITPAVGGPQPRGARGDGHVCSACGGRGSMTHRGGTSAGPHTARRCQERPRSGGHARVCEGAQLKQQPSLGEPADAGDVCDVREGGGVVARAGLREDTKGQSRVRGTARCVAPAGLPGTQAQCPSPPPPTPNQVAGGAGTAHQRLCRPTDGGCGPADGGSPRPTSPQKPCPSGAAVKQPPHCSSPSTPETVDGPPCEVRGPGQGRLPVVRAVLKGGH